MRVVMGGLLSTCRSIDRSLPRYNRSNARVGPVTSTRPEVALRAGRAIRQSRAGPAFVEQRQDLIGGPDFGATRIVDGDARGVEVFVLRRGPRLPRGQDAAVLEGGEQDHVGGQSIEAPQVAGGAVAEEQCGIGGDDDRRRAGGGGKPPPNGPRKPGFGGV